MEQARTENQLWWLVQPRPLCHVSGHENGACGGACPCGRDDEVLCGAISAEY